MPTTLTTFEAAELVGLTPKAIKHRLDRRQLQYVVKGGRRRIPVAELVRAGLLDDGAAAGAVEAAGAAVDDPSGAERAYNGSRPHSAPNGPDGGPRGFVDYSDVIRELVGKVEQQAVELGRLRALTAGSEGEADRLRAELGESRARVGELEAREASRRRWFRRG